MLRIRKDKEEDLIGRVNKERGHLSFKKEINLF